MDAVIVDTGVWYALFDRRNSHYRRAGEKAELFESLGIVVPWPTVYETLRTRFVRNIGALSRFERFLKAPNVQFIEDEAFRASALELSLDSSLRKGRPLSMVDCLIRIILVEAGKGIRYLATFNPGDFADVCRKTRVEMI